MIAIAGFIGYLNYKNLKFTDVVTEIARGDVIVESPTKIDLVGSPVTVRGKAKGTWFFEAVFSMQIEDSDGSVLGRGVANAEGEWMTENMVPFSGDIVFNSPKGNKGFLVLYKDNPSGLPENSKSIRIPITFN